MYMSFYRTLLAASLLASAPALWTASSAENQPTQGEPDGTLHIHELTIPPSSYWSPEFTKAYAKMVAEMRAAVEPQLDPHPARTAPKAEWDKFYTDQERGLSEPLQWDLKHYPVDVVDTKIAGVHVGIITPKDGVAPENRRRVLIDLHGGGFVDFSGLSFGQLESIPVASLGKIKVVTVDYRQSPYYKYPAASEDVEAVYKHLLKQYKPEAIGIFGCSAGGFLTAQVVSWFQAKALPRPGAVGIFCAGIPGADKSGDSAIWGLGIMPESPPKAGTAQASPVSSAVHWYMEGVDEHDLKAFPGTSDRLLAKFPPTLFVAGTRTADGSWAVTGHARLLKLRVDSYLYLMEGGTHASYVFFSNTPESRDTNAYIARWFNQHLAR